MFPNLFGEGNSADQQNDYSEEAQFAKHWGWYQYIYQLAKGEIGRFDSITEEPLYKCLTLLTFEKQKAQIEIKQAKRKQ